MDNSNTTVVSFDPYPPPPTLSIYPNATTKRANVKLVQLGTVARPEVPALAAAPAAVASPPPSPPRSPPSPPAADPYQPSERRGWSGWCRVCKLLLPGFGACCCLLGCVCSAHLLLVYCLCNCLLYFLSLLPFLPPSSLLRIQQQRPAVQLTPATDLHLPFPLPAGFYAYNEDDLAYALSIPNIVVGLKSHIVPTGKVKSDMALFPYVQYPITIGASCKFGAGRCNQSCTSLQGSWRQWWCPWHACSSLVHSCDLPSTPPIHPPSSCLLPRPLLQWACAPAPRTWGRTGAASAPSTPSGCGRFFTSRREAAAAALTFG